MRFRLGAFAVTVAVLVVASAASAQEPTTLRYRWVKGDELRYRFTAEASTTMSGVPGIGVMTTGQTLVQVMHMTVEDVAADGTATVRQTIESMRMEINSPMGQMVVDSASDSTEGTVGSMLAKVTAAMVGEPLTVTILPTGKIVGIEGTSRLLEKAFQAMPEDLARTAAANQLRTLFSEDSIKKVLEQGFGTLPEHPLAAGEAWTGLAHTDPVSGRMTVTTTSVLKDVVASNGTVTARIGLTLAVKPSGDGAAIGPGGAVIEIAESTGVGEILFDVTRGRVQHGQITSEIPMTMSMPGPGGSPTTVRAVVRSSATTDLVENQQ